jgi:CheY-like chemotaxis protein
MNKVILLVEDNPDDVELAQHALRESRLSSEMVVANDGVDALDYLFSTGKYLGRDPCKTPVVVLLDLKLPKLDGLEVLQRMRADSRTKLMPVVVMTSSREESDMVASYLHGANSFIQKSLDFSQFIETARQLDAYWLGINQVPVPCNCRC